jgi:hypothetical protein
MSGGAVIRTWPRGASCSSDSAAAASSIPASARETDS